MTFEAKKKELAKIADKLESDKTTLEEAAALYSQGVALSKECLALLVSEQGKITVIGENGEENPFELN